MPLWLLPPSPESPPFRCVVPSATACVDLALGGRLHSPGSQVSTAGSHTVVSGRVSGVSRRRKHHCKSRSERPNSGVPSIKQCAAKRITIEMKPTCTPPARATGTSHVPVLNTVQYRVCMPNAAIHSAIHAVRLHPCSPSDGASQQPSTLTTHARERRDKGGASRSDMMHQLSGMDLVLEPASPAHISARQIGSEGSAARERVAPGALLCAPSWARDRHIAAYIQGRRLHGLAGSDVPGV